MALFKVFKGTSKNLPSSIHDGYAYLTTDDGKFYIDSSNQRILINPDTSSADRISYLQDGVMTDVGAVLDQILQTSVLMEIHSTEEWAQQAGGRVSVKGTLYVYTDGYTLQNKKKIPRIKIGDGNAFISSLPFIDQALRSQLADHINDTNVHVSLEEKLIWWNKLNFPDEPVVDKTLIFNRD